jgi:hypothetical protein
LVLQNLRPLFAAQLSLAKGLSYVYRVTTGARGGRSDPELVTNPDELHEAIQAIHAGGGYGAVAEDEGGENAEKITHRYYFLTTGGSELMTVAPVDATTAIVGPVSDADVQFLVTKLYSFSPSLIDRAKRAVVYRPPT